LRKALIDSGLGENLVGSGLDGNLRQLSFGAGLKGFKLPNADRVEALILDTLRDLVENGIDRDMIEAALNTMEFRLRENNTGSFPRGLSLMLRSLTTWLYDGDPFAPLAFEAPLAAVRQHWAEDTKYFESLIDRYLLQNNHRVTLTLEPDPQLQQRMAALETEKLVQVKGTLTDHDLNHLIEETKALQARQEAPDSPEALATIPRLTLADLKPESGTIPIEKLVCEETPVLYHDLFTNGIVYVDVGLNTHTLPSNLLPYLPLFGQSLTKIGTAKEDFVKLSQRIGRQTGGVWASSLTSSVRDRAQAASWLFLRGKGTMAQTGHLLDIMRMYC
jgi:Zn-dependent M16 (insulinase) family peptidase